MPVTEDPITATEIAVFGQGASQASSISYDLPLPGSFTFQRIVPVALADGAFTAAAAAAGVPLTALGVVQYANGGIRQVDPDRLMAFLNQTVAPGTMPSLRRAGAFGLEVLNPNLNGDAKALAANGGATPALGDDIQTQSQRRINYLAAAANQAAGEVNARINVANAPPVTTIDLQVPGHGQSVRQVSYDLSQAGVPQIAIVQTWRVSSFLGEYGLGRTLQTFTLLPGEQTTISIDTWSTDTSSQQDSSSIFDSSDVNSDERYTSALTVQSGAAYQDQGGWSASVGTQASASGSFLGIVSGSASVSGSYAANYQQSNQGFSSNVSSTNQDHATQVNSSRNQSVSQSTADSTATGTSTATVRTISNTNLRRVLNFVFRELNQEYLTVTALADVSLAFYNGNPGSAQIVPLYQIRDFVDTWIVPDQCETVARTILAMVCDCTDDEGNPQTMLQVGHANGGTFTWQDAELKADGSLDYDGSVLDSGVSWRVKPGPIGQDKEQQKVPGVVTVRDTIVLRTDNVVGEALLGQADALDPYASALQATDIESRSADVSWRQTQVKRTSEALGIVDTLPEAQKVTGYREMLVPPPEIQVVPVAAAENDGR
jgi:hypothetical protein